MSIKNYSTPTKKYKLLLSSLHNIYRLVNSTFEVKELVSRLARLLCQIFDTSFCMITILDTNKQYSAYRCVISGKKKYIADKKKKIKTGIEAKIIRKFVSVKQSHLIGLPLVSEDIVGLIILKRGKHEVSFDDFDIELLNAIAEQSIIAIKNLQLYEEQQKIILGSIKSLVTFLDMRVPREYAHSSYFTKLVIDLGRQMHLDQKQIEGIKYASLLHDAGKAEIPPEILMKRSKLTSEEFKIVKKSPLRGAQILRPLQMLKPVIPIIMHHHEKFNGTGYPSRLKKGQIPMGSRVMAVADAFEAMVYGRPYRERIDIDSAIKEIKKKSGIQFDPKVVEAFLKVVKKGFYRKYLQLNKQKVYNESSSRPSQEPVVKHLQF